MRATLAGIACIVLALASCVGASHPGGPLVLRQVETPAPSEGNRQGRPAVAASPAVLAVATSAVPAVPPELAFVRDGDLWVANADGSRARRLTEGGADREPDWSPDGQHLVFLRGNGPQTEVYIIRADGTDLHRLTDDTMEQDTPRWSPRGGRIAYVQARDANGDGRVDPGEGQEIWVVEETGRAARRVATGSDPAWSPDGGRLAYIAESDQEPPSLHVVDVDSQQDRRLLSLRDIPDDLGPGYGIPFRLTLLRLHTPSWSADGRLLSVSADGHTGVVITVASDGTRLRFLALTYEGEVGRAVFAPRGSLLAIERRPASGYGQIMLVDTASGQTTTTFGSQELGYSASEPAWSPDGQLIAMVAVSDAGGWSSSRRELLVLGVDGAVRNRVTVGAVAEPTWNPRAVRERTATLGQERRD